MADKHKPVILLLVLAIVASLGQALDSTGPTNRFYSIPFYFGARVKDWNNTKSYYEDNPVRFFWSHNWNIDYKGNLWVCDKRKHSVYYISKENATYNAIFKVSGKEFEPGEQNGNVAMGSFNEPMSITIFDNNPDVRMEEDNLWLVKIHDKFFDDALLEKDPELRKLKAFCMREVTQDTYEQCGVKVPRTFQKPTFTEEEEKTLTLEEKEQKILEAELAYARVDHRRVKLISFGPKPVKPFAHDEDGIDPRIVYIADMANHCIRRIVAKQANVDTFAGICGAPGFKDGVFGQNQLNRPELVATDHNGTLYIYDSGNQYIRVVDPVTRIMQTLIHGSCKLDYMTSSPSKNPVPFQLELKPMICFTTWIKIAGNPDGHLTTLPAKPEKYDESAEIIGYGTQQYIYKEEDKPEGEKEGSESTDGADGAEAPEAEAGESSGDNGGGSGGGGGDEGGGGGDEGEDAEAQVTDEEKQCYDQHSRQCQYFDPHPLIMEGIYYDAREEYLALIRAETKKLGEDPENDRTYFDKEANKMKMVKDMRRDPVFEARLKLCTVSYEDPEGGTNSDGNPTILTDLKFCHLNEKCCGAEYENQDGSLIPHEGCCNVI